MRLYPCAGGVLRQIHVDTCTRVSLVTDTAVKNFVNYLMNLTEKLLRRSRRDLSGNKNVCAKASLLAYWTGL
jgi:hypothetical protein